MAQPTAASASPRGQRMWHRQCRWWRKTSLEEAENKNQRYLKQSKTIWKHRVSEWLSGWVGASLAFLSQTLTKGLHEKNWNPCLRWSAQAAGWLPRMATPPCPQGSAAGLKRAPNSDTSWSPEPSFPFVTWNHNVLTTSEPRAWNWSR